MDNGNENGYWKRKEIERLISESNDTHTKVHDIKNKISIIESNIAHIKDKFMTHVDEFHDHTKDDDRRFASIEESLRDIKAGVDDIALDSALQFRDVDWKIKLIMILLPLGSGGMGGYLASRFLGF